MTEEKDEKIPFIIVILVWIVGIFTICTAVMIVDQFCNNARIINKIVYGKDCNYITPPGYKLVYSQKEHGYAVKVEEFEGEYLYNGRYGIQPMYVSIAAPCIFSDTCGAKAYLKAYIKSKQPKITDFK